ncbi:MAG: hypothetical protein RIR00_2305 [Pseudomonadota bacterium]|jgi:tol-pal system protein YbgF
MLPRRPALLPAILVALFAVPAAHAGMFDEDARKELAEYRQQTENRFDTLSKGQLSLSGQLQNQADEIARLRGQIETLNYELEAAKKRQQDFYVDLDNRLRKLETAAAQQAAAAEGQGEAGKPAAAKVDPAAEARDYEAALNLFKANKYKDAAAAFESFVKTYGEGQYAAKAQYWQGNAWYAQRDCKKAIDVYTVVVSRWPDSSSSPDALLNIAACQQELAMPQPARKNLETLVARYPDSSAATTARERLKKK